MADPAPGLPPGRGQEAPLQALSQIDRFRAHQVATLYRDAMPGTVGSLVAGFILVGLLIFMGGLGTDAAIVFSAILAANSIFRGLLWLAHRRASPPPMAWRPWLRWIGFSALIGGLVWGGGAVLLVWSESFDGQLLVLLVVTAVAAGAVSAFGSHLPAFLMNFLPMMLVPTAWVASRGDVPHLALAGLLLAWIATISVVARNFNRSVTEAYRLRFENLDLVEDLRRQKEVAEEANVAKSRFLASANHDLRQPVHALGMFIAALRRRPMDDETRRLVTHIEGSANALDGLFTALLDISQLDAGILQPRLVAFPLQPLLAAICRDHADEAAQKGVRLSLQPCSLIVRSEPVLLERILRNIVANAVRYTSSGRVLVGCRRRQRASVEIWDTGVGIPRDQQGKIFEEFYQLHNPERDRSKGLGLGLAIVRRLSLLLDHPVTLRSEPHRGSVFKVAVPIAAEGDLPPKPQGDAVETPHGHGLILVIDDEIAIQDAMRLLLEGWGYDVIVAGSRAEMLEQVAACPDRPDLIICDCRLRDNENGIDVIQQLQSEYNEDIPGVLITGDTAAERLREAQESGFLLLHKPVPNGKLRAAIGNLIATRDAVEQDA